MGRPGKHSSQPRRKKTKKRAPGERGRNTKTEQEGSGTRRGHPNLVTDENPAKIKRTSARALRKRRCEFYRQKGQQENWTRSCSWFCLT